MNPAKSYYEEFHRINPPRLGPYLHPRKFNSDQHQQLQTLHRTCWRDIQQEIDQCGKKTALGEIFVPSPWHAWAFLTELHKSLIDVGDKSIGIPDYFPVPVFRGQTNGDYEPIPSLYRTTTKDRGLEQKCLEAFSFIFNQEFLWQSLGVLPPPSGAKATAQHYGIKTNLLDITADPAVAVYFASLSNTRKPGETASVFVFDLSRFLSSGVEFILPPPVVQRLYLQRGAFFAFSEEGLPHINEGFAKVSFPFNPEFQFLGGGDSQNILLPDEWFQGAVNWSKQWAASGNSLPHDQMEICEVFDQIGYPNIYNDHPGHILANWADNLEDMVYWYAMRVKGKSEGMLSGICEGIARTNPELIRFMVGLYDVSAQRLKQEGALSIDLGAQEQLRDIWTEALDRTHPNRP